jgi:hypothetical protein
MPGAGRSGRARKYGSRGTFARFAAVAAVVAIPWVVWVTVRPADARNAREAVAWADDDLIWSAAPAGFTESSSYRPFAEASWVLRWSHEAEDRRSSVGRWFTPQLAGLEDVRAWVVFFLEGLRWARCRRLDLVIFGLLPLRGA